MLRILIFFLFCTLAACGQNTNEQTATQQASGVEQGDEKKEVESAGQVNANSGEKKANTTDLHSFANTHEIVITHLHLDLKVDFEKQQLLGKNTISYEKLDPQVQQLYLDTRELTINRIEADGNALQWQWGEKDENLGQALIINLPENEAKIDIFYASAPSASGLQWLKPLQTSGKTHPFLFTQSQAIHARSWIPLQDTPAVRHTYSADIQVDPSLRAVMSADNNPEKSENGDYHFEMPQPIPSYLIALAVGDLEYQEVSEHVGVYAEAAYLEAAAYEFAETENMITAAEAMYGEYRWGRYDLLVLPPSFPFGGMENPRLSFITPTILAGDRSLDSLIAHELAHSWSGNLVTNSNWNDLWLNEGFTSYFESRITEAVHGTDRMQMEAVLSYEALVDELKTLAPEMQLLAIDLKGKDPDDGFSGVAYDKGRFFLDWIENQVGREKFDQFLNSYFSYFAFKSINTEDFLMYLDANLIQQNPNEINMKEVKQWVYEPGLPDFAVVPHTDKFSKIDALLTRYENGEAELKDFPVDSWTTQEWLYFLTTLSGSADHTTLQRLDAQFNLTQAGNNEIAHVWLLMSIRNNYQPAFERLEEYLKLIGRRKLIVPLYQELVKNEDHKTWAEKVYADARVGYHNLAQGTVDDIFDAEIKTD